MKAADVVSWDQMFQTVLMLAIKVGEWNVQQIELKRKVADQAIRIERLHNRLADEAVNAVTGRLDAIEARLNKLEAGAIWALP